MPTLGRALLGLIADSHGRATLNGLARQVGARLPGQPPRRLDDIQAALGRLVEARLVVAHHSVAPTCWAVSSRGREHLASDWGMAAVAPPLDADADAVADVVVAGSGTDARR